MEIRKNIDENWIKYNPLNNKEEETYYVTSIVQDLDGTKIILDNEKDVFEVFFDGFIPIVRITDEGIRMRTWGEVQKKYENKKFFNGWFLYKVEDSELVKWALEESCGCYEEEQLIHYCIVTGEDLIDILSSFEPKISVSKCN